MGKKTGLLIVLAILASQITFAQSNKGYNPFPFSPGKKEVKPHPLIELLSKFSFEASSGYNGTFYRHNLQGFSILNHNNNIYLLDNRRGPGNFLASGYRDWVSDPRELKLLNPQSENILVNSDTTYVGYKAYGGGVPINLIVHYKYERFRVGLGTSIELHRIGKFNPTNHKEILPSFELEQNLTVKTRFFGLFGVKVWEYGDYSFYADTQFGLYDLGNAFVPDLLDKSMFFNFGAVAEKNISEYFRVFGRASFDTKSYQSAFPETNVVVNHSLPGVFFHFGVSLSVPEKPRCKTNNCQVQMMHLHGGREYRGQPFYKKQNPGYGELHPKLLKHKRKNIRIRNPF
jgi:hypothetical protein